jgi:hypothetical protein
MDSGADETVEMFVTQKGALLVEWWAASLEY